MPKISDLIKDMAAVLHIEQTTVQTYARRLREAGLLSQGGRGRGGADATPLDAARLLIALSVDAYAKDAPQTVRDFGRLRCSRETPLRGESNRIQYDKLRMAKLLRLPADAALEDVLAAIIAAYGGEDEEAATILDVHSGRWGQYPGTIVTIRSISVDAQASIGGHRYLFEQPVHGIITQTLLKKKSGQADAATTAEYEAASAEYARLHKTYYRGIRRESTIATPEIVKIGEMLAGYREPGKFQTDEEWGERMAAQILNQDRSDGE